MAGRQAWNLRDDRGNLAVEFALVAPILVLLILAIADLGLATLELSNIRAAARAGLQAVLSDANATDRASTIAAMAAPSADVAVTTSCGCADGTAIVCGDTCAAGAVRRTVTVTVTRDLPLLVPWPGMPDPLPLTGQAEARVR